MGSLLQDLRYALRVLWRSPGFTAVAVTTLGLGIGANTAIFSVVDAVLLRPLSVSGLDRMVVVRQDLPGLNLENTPLAATEVEGLLEQDDLFQAIGGFTAADFNLTGDGDPVRLSAMATVGDFFDVFDVHPHVGRFYGAENSTNGRHDVVVLSHRLWQRVSGGAPGIIGRALELNGQSYEIVGVMPPEFRYPRDAELWTPLQITPRVREQGALKLTTVGRLAPGVTAERLQSRLRILSTRWNDQFVTDARFEFALFAVPFVEFLAGPLRPVLFVLMSAVGFVLLIACANVANLQLVRTMARAGEIAVRGALGAGRARIVRQLMVESMVLAAAGGLLGLYVGDAALDLVRGFAGVGVTLAGTIGGVVGDDALAGLRLDGRILAFTVLVSLLSALAAAVVPALRVARVQPQQVLRGAGPDAAAATGRRRFLQGSVVLQLALALVLLLGSGLLVRSLERLLATDPGFQPEGVHTFQLTLPSSEYQTGAHRLAFADAFLRRLRAVPGVETVGLGWTLPFSGLTNSSPFEIIDKPYEPGMPERHADTRFASPEYFRTLRIPLLRGRGFSEADAAGSQPVVLIDEQLAGEFFPGENPIGRKIDHAWGPVTIVGVVGSVNHGELGEPPKATVYYPYQQVPVGSMFVVARSSLDLPDFARTARTALGSIDPGLPIYDVRSMEERIAASLGTRELAMGVLTGFAVLSLTLAVIGIYGVMRYSVNQRTREIGIRVAVGARPGEVSALVTRQGMTLAALGLSLGLLLAFAATGLLSGLLFGISPHDPVTFVGATVLLAGSALLACWLPARRASRVDPITALRSE